MLTLIGSFLVACFVLCLGGMIYGAVRLPGDPRGRFAIGMVALWIVTFWLVSGVLAIHAL